MTKLLGSLNRDVLPNEMPEGSWPNAKNVVINKRGNAITNEDGALNITPVASGSGSANYPTKTMIGFTCNATDTIVFFATGNYEDSEVGIIKADKKYYPKLKDASAKIVLKLNTFASVEAVCETRSNGQTIVVFKDSDGVPKLLNLDCMPFKVDNDFTVNSADVAKAQATIKLFPDWYFPVIAPYDLQVLEGQGSLKRGVYYPVVAYELSDGTITNWSTPYNGVPVSADKINGQSTAISGGLDGDNTSKAISINFTNTDTHYQKIRVGYLFVSGNKTRAFYERSVIITGTTTYVLITGNKTTELDLTEVLTPNSVYKTIETLATVQKKLYLGGVNYNDIINYQTYANAITLEWIRERQVSIDGLAKNANIGTYQDGSITYFSKTFKSGECYAFVIKLNLKYGLPSKRFHIPGRASSGTDKSVMTAADPTTYNYDQLDGGAAVYKYQVINTSTQTTSTRGAMGFWENENEQYPLDPANLANVHPDYANIPGISAGNRKVRHHVFPDLTYLDNGGNTEKFIEGTFGTYPVQDITTKVFGIKVTNVEIPSALLPFVDSWEIEFAERDNASIRILGSDCPSRVSGSSPELVNFQAFDMMVSKPNLPPSYLKPVYLFNNDGSVVGQEANFVEYCSSPNVTNTGLISPFQYKIRALFGFSYLGENTTIPYNNSGYSDNEAVKIANASGTLAGIEGVAFDMTTAGSPQTIALCDFCIYRRNVYLNFQTQKYITTGMKFKVTVSGVQSAQDIYGGDVYINRVSINPLNTGTKAFSYVCESAANIGFRNEDTSLNKYFAPKYSNPTPSWYGYDTSFNCINDFDQSPVHYPTDTCSPEDQTIFQNKIVYSLVDTTEGKNFNWRIFKANSYFDSVNDKGALYKLTGDDRSLYIHHKYSLFIAEIKDSLATSNEEIYLGVTDIFARPPREVLTTATGYAGTQSKFSCIVCKLGYCFVDKAAGKVFIYNRNTGLREISDEGMFNFFLNNNTFAVEGIDNPFIGKGFIIGYDDQYNRLLVTKIDTFAGIPVYEYTLSYSLDANQGKGGWVGFHSFIPHVYITVRQNLFCVSNQDNRYYQMNASGKAKYFGVSGGAAATNDSYIEFVSNQANDTSKVFESLEWVSICEISGVNYPTTTFSHLIVYNDSQCSSKLSLQAESGKWYSKNARNVKGGWHFNNFRDLVKNIANAIFVDKTFEVDATNIAATKAWHKRSQFISKYLIFRIITDNSQQKNLHLTEISANFNKSDL